MRTLMKSHFLRGSAARGTPSGRLSGNVDAAGVPVELAATRDTSSMHGKMSTLVEKETFKVFLRDENGIGIGNARALDKFLENLEQNGKIDFMHVLKECGWKPRKVIKQQIADRERKKKEALMKGEYNTDKFIPKKLRGYPTLDGNIAQSHGSTPFGKSSATRPRSSSTTRAPKAAISGAVPESHGTTPFANGSSSARVSDTPKPAIRRPQTARAEIGRTAKSAPITADEFIKAKFYSKQGKTRPSTASSVKRVQGVVKSITPQPKRPAKSAGATRPSPNSARKQSIQPPKCAFTPHRQVKDKVHTTPESRNARAGRFLGQHQQKQAIRRMSDMAKHRLRQQGVTQKKMQKLRAWQYQDYQDSQILSKMGGSRENRWC